MKKFVDGERYISGSIICKKYDVSTPTLYRWEQDGLVKTIRLPGGTRKYREKDINALFGDESTNQEEKKAICYARVSSAHQKEDLQRQIEYLKSEFPHHEIIQDIGSGLNWKRKGFLSILEQSFEGNIGEVVVAYKDRLCRFGFELVEWIFKKCGVKLVVLSQTERNEENDSRELAEDLLAIITVFVARNNGLRAGQNRRKRKEVEEKKEKERDKDGNGENKEHQGTNSNKRRKTTESEENTSLSNQTTEASS